MTKYFLYIRKSTDEDDRQVLSLEAQETELREFAKKEQLTIVDTFHESHTAKEPGRPIFNKMLERIEKGEAEGIISWHPDRLARNSVDGGRIIFLIDSDKIQFLKFPTFWFEATPQGKFMLNIAFGQSKYFVDNLSENTKRGLRQKLRRGELPGYAPLGYLNDLRNHTMVKDPERFLLVKKLFELYATGNYSLKSLKEKITSAGLLSRKGNKLSISVIQSVLQNPFYYGPFKYNDELYQGTHKPMTTKKLFEKCQQVLQSRARPVKRLKEVHAFRGLLKCGECGCMITSEIQRGHIYYRCTKKKGPCSQKYIREETLAEQISDILQIFSIPSFEAKKMVAELDKDENEKFRAGFSFSQNLKSQIKECEEKLEKLLDAHLNNDISREEYLEKKQKLLNQKVEISEKLANFEKKGGNWLEPAKKFILASNQAQIAAKSGNLQERAEKLKKAGSNMLLTNRKIKYFPRGAWEILENLPVFGAEPRSGEAQNVFKKAENLAMLRGLDEVRTWIMENYTDGSFAPSR
ncbi:MAG: recombinase family protein [Candidatus Pacebacteria bacterium]|nr:recombinase family protein [Candidatus Paceibacterota bacterium]